MKTVRFSQVVQKSGTPDTHVILTKPAKDAGLQKAIKGNRILTLYQPTIGTSTSYGTVGFEQGQLRQYLIFPKSLRPFASRRVVGIKYDLLESARPETEHNTPKVAKSKSPPPRQKPKPPSTPAKEPSKIVHFPKEQSKHPVPAPEIKQPPPQKDGDALPKKVRLAIRKAMALLEKGKQIAAFNLLKRTLDD